MDMAQRILITGGAGYLGSELVRQALAQGWEVAATAFTRRPAEDLARSIALDIRDEGAVGRAFADFQPNVVIHTAYRQTGPDLWATTVVGAGVVAQAAQQAGAQLIHMSSDAIFDGARVEPYTEEDEPSPITPYGEAKAAAERLVSELAPRALIVRTSLLYGGPTPGAHEQLALDAADGHAEIAFFRDELRCPVVVDDLAAALLELTTSTLDGVLHVAGADVVSRYDFARLVVAAHQRSPDQLRSALSAESGLHRPRNCALDCRRANGVLRTRLRGIYEVLGS
jgi:dTDP-4-dehydrorhamnose reductase